MYNSTAAPVDLLIPPVEAVAPVSESESELRVAHEPPADSTAWRLHIAARCEGARDLANFAGVAADARDGPDALDRTEPPMAPGSALSFYFLEAQAEEPLDGIRRTTDLRPPIPRDGEPALQGRRWTFDVAMNDEDGSPKEVQLDFGGLDPVPREIELRVIDRALARMIDLPNYPNPVAAWTVIRFETARAGKVRVEVFDLAGRRLRTLLDEHRDAGLHELAWRVADDQGRSLAPGIYALRLVAPDRTDVRKLAKVQ